MPYLDRTGRFGSSANESAAARMSYGHISFGVQRSPSNVLQQTSSMQSSSVVQALGPHVEAQSEPCGVTQQSSPTAQSATVAHVVGRASWQVAPLGAQYMPLVDGQQGLPVGQSASEMHALWSDVHSSTAVHTLPEVVVQHVSPPRHWLSASQK